MCNNIFTSVSQRSISLVWCWYKLNYLRPETHEVLAQVVLSTTNTLQFSYITALPVLSKLSKPRGIDFIQWQVREIVFQFLLVIQSLLLDHGQVSFSSQSLTSIVIPHSSGHLLIVHFFRSVGLHAAPGLGKLQGVGDLWIKQ